MYPVRVHVSIHYIIFITWLQPWLNFWWKFEFFPPTRLSLFEAVWSLTVLILERGGERRLLLHFCFFLRHPTLLLLIPQVVSSSSSTHDKGARPPLDVTRDPVPYLLGCSVKEQPPLDKEASHILLLLPIPSYLSSLGALQKACAPWEGSVRFLSHLQTGWEAYVGLG